MYVYKQFIKLIKRIEHNFKFVNHLETSKGYFRIVVYNTYLGVRSSHVNFLGARCSHEKFRCSMYT